MSSTPRALGPTLAALASAALACHPAVSAARGAIVRPLPMAPIPAPATAASTPRLVSVMAADARAAADSTGGPLGCLRGRNLTAPHAESRMPPPERDLLAAVRNHACDPLR